MIDEYLHLFLYLFFVAIILTANPFLVYQNASLISIISFSTFQFRNLQLLINFIFLIITLALFFYNSFSLLVFRFFPFVFHYFLDSFSILIINSINIHVPAYFFQFYISELLYHFCFTTYTLFIAIFDCFFYNHFSCILIHSSSPIMYHNLKLISIRLDFSVSFLQFQSLSLLLQFSFSFFLFKFQYIIIFFFFSFISSFTISFITLSFPFNFPIFS